MSATTPEVQRIEKPVVIRFSVARRIEHWVLFLSFTTLAITGLIQKYNDNSVSLWLLGAMGGVEAVRIIHRIAAVVMLVQTLYHILDLAYKIFVLRTDLSMLPGIKDAKDGIQAIAYNLGFTKKRPRMGRYTFDEKMEYWAMIWGTLVMAITGFMLWNPILTASKLPGVIIPAAKAAHGAEAVLAVLAILVWHLYHVHLKHFNKSIFHGKLTREEMEEDHPLELEQIETTEPKVIPPAILKKRQQIFFPIAAVVAVASLAGMVYFVTYEETALETIPPREEEIPIYQTPPPETESSNNLPAMPAFWQNTGQAFRL